MRDRRASALTGMTTSVVTPERFAQGMTLGLRALKGMGLR